VAFAMSSKDIWDFLEVPFQTKKYPVKTGIIGFDQELTDLNQEIIGLNQDLTG
jgi:hypothetical protein